MFFFCKFFDTFKIVFNHFFKLVCVNLECWFVEFQLFRDFDSVFLNHSNCVCSFVSIQHHIAMFTSSVAVDFTELVFLERSFAKVHILWFCSMSFSWTQRAVNYSMLITITQSDEYWKDSIKLFFKFLSVRFLDFSHKKIKREINTHVSSTLYSICLYLMSTSFYIFFIQNEIILKKADFLFVSFLYVEFLYKYILIYFCKSLTRRYFTANQRSFVLLMLLSILTGIYFARFFITVVICLSSSRAISVAEKHFSIDLFNSVFIYIFWNKIFDLWFIIESVFSISFIFLKSSIIFNDFFHFDFHWAILFLVNLIQSFWIKIFFQCHHCVSE